MPRYLEPMVFRPNRRVFVLLAMFFFSLGGAWIRGCGHERRNVKHGRSRDVCLG